MILFKKPWKEYKHFLLLLFYGLLYIWFYYLEKIVVAKYDMFSPFDLKIPFIKEFVIPYLFWYIYMIFGFIYLSLRLTSLTLMIIINVSTVFVKQHSILDGLWAVALSIILYIGIYLVPDLIEERQKTERRKKKTAMSMESAIK